MKRICAVLGIVFGLIGSAHAQSGSSQTPAALNTEVNTNFANNTAGAITPTILRQMLLDIIASNANFLSANTFAPASGVAITVNPTANTYNNAINITQTGPTSGSTAGPIAFNLIQGTTSATVTGSGVGQDGLNNSNNILLKVRYVLGGTNWQGQASAAGQFTASVSNGAGNASSPDAVGVGGSAYINVSNPSTTAGIFGVVPYVYVDSAGSISQAVGSEIDVWVKTGGVATQRIGQRIRAQGDIQSSGGIDAAVVVDNFGAAGAAWKSLITLSKNGSGVIPMDVTASLFNNDAAMTLANVFNSSNVTLTGDFANFPNFRIGGSGIARFGSGGSLPAAPVVVQAAIAAGGNSEMFSSTNTTTGFNGFDANTSTGSANGSFIVDEPGRTTTRFGLTVGNWVELIASGAGNNGLIIGTLTNVPIVLGINNVEVGRVTAAGLTWKQNVTFTTSGDGINGTATNDNANAGVVGEYISAECTSNTATITVTIASPAVVTWTAHGYSNTNGRQDACPVNFTTSGALPTGITAGTNYWIIPSTIGANTFQIATSIANALAGTAVNTSGSQSGVQTGQGGALSGAGGSLKSITGLSLTAGDWDVQANTCNNLAAGVTQTFFYVAINTVVDVLGTAPNNGLSALTGISAATGLAPCTATRTVRASLSGTTTYFVTSLPGYSGGSNNDNLYGGMYARRRR